MFFRIFIIVFSFISTSAFAQGADCSSLLPICNNFTYNPKGRGIDDFANPANIADCFSFGKEYNSAWYKIRIIKDGTLTFTLVPENPKNDYDFGIWGPNVSCNALGSPIRCNTAAEDGETGLTLTSSFTSQGPGAGSNKCKFLEVKAGEEYIILIDNSRTSNLAGFQLNFGGTAVLGNWLDTDFRIISVDTKIQCNQLTSSVATTLCYNSQFNYNWEVIETIKNTKVFSQNNKLNNININLPSGSYKMTVKITNPLGAVVTKDTTFSIKVATLDISAEEKACFENNAKTTLTSRVNGSDLPSEYKLEWYAVGIGKIGEGEKMEVTQAGNYTAVMLYDFCKINSDTVSIKEYCPPVVYVPTAFSPNGDGLNDNLRVWGKRFVNLTVEVYNQWGSVLFAKKIATENESVTWDGITTSGIFVPSGSYVVQTSYFDAVTSRPISERHVVSVIR